MVLKLTTAAFSAELPETFNAYRDCHAAQYDYDFSGKWQPSWTCHAPQKIARERDQQTNAEQATSQRKSFPTRAWIAIVGWLLDVVEDPIKLFTFVLSVFTIGLYVETAGLRRTADKQKLDSQEALLTAKRQSDISDRQADIMQMQARIAAKVIDLEQPYLLVKDVTRFSFPDADSPLTSYTFNELCAEIEIVNYGRTPAVLHIVHATILPLEFTPRRVNLELFPVRPITDIVGTQRTDVVVVAIKGIKLQSIIAEQIMSGNTHVFVYGTLVYSNGSGSVIETCFAFDWQGGDSKCVRSTKPEHNYRKTYEGEEAQTKIADSAEPSPGGPSFASP